MKWNTKSLFLYTLFILLSVAAMLNIDMVFSFINDTIRLFFPILLGLLFAFILNVPMRGFEKIWQRITSKSQKPLKEQTIQSLSLLCTLVSIGLIIVLASTMVIPTLINSVKSIYPLLKEKGPEWLAVLNSYQIDLSLISDWLNGLNLEQLSGNATSLLGSAFDAATSTLSGITNFVFGLIIAIYILLSKRSLSKQVKKITYANLKKETADRIYSIATLIQQTYAKFLSGQCIEAIILGILIFISFSLFKLPYAFLIGFLTSLFAFVPYVGAFVSCAIGVFLSLLVHPSKALICLIVYLVVQFIENQFIYPHVVGSSVGLAPLWTLIAALIGGKLFGLVGIVFFIPLTATLIALVKEDTQQKLIKKGYQ